MTSSQVKKSLELKILIENICMSAVPPTLFYTNSMFRDSIMRSSSGPLKVNYITYTGMKAVRSVLIVSFIVRHPSMSVKIAQSFQNDNLNKFSPCYNLSLCVQY